MNQTPKTAAARNSQTSARSRGRFSLLCAAALAGGLMLSGCGGGGDVGISAAGSVPGAGAIAGAGIGVNVVVGGSNFAHASSGQVLQVVAGVGQAIEFDANEPVSWSFSVNGSPLFVNGTTVDVGGVTITQVQDDPSRVVLHSNFYGPALLPIDVGLVATSTFDLTQVSTIELSLR
jgi:hypothetical protein